jgi:hypothetical protein
MIKSRRMRWAGHIARTGENKNAYVLLVLKAGRKEPLERPRRMWVDNIKMDVGEIGWCRIEWIVLAQDRDKWRVERCRCVRLTNLPASMRRLSRQGAFFNISQPYRPPRSVTGIALLLF